MNITPITYTEACRFVSEHHRHHKPPQGMKFAIAVSDDDRVVGVAIVGRPVSRNLDNGWTLEVTRCCTDGTKNACSMLYGASWRVAKELGYKRVITYILQEESGTSLKAAGWRLVGEAGGGNWNKKTRPRVDSDNQQMKLRWEVAV